MAVNARFEKLLRSPDPVAELRRFAQHLLEEGADPGVLRTQFEDVRGQLRKEAREEDEDAVMDVLDFLTGWCSPHMGLPPRRRVT